MTISYLHSLSCNKSCLLTSQFSKPLFINQTQKKLRFSISFCLKQNESGIEQVEEEEEEEFTVVTAVKSRYNEIVIVDTFASRYLLLDSTSENF